MIKKLWDSAVAAAERYRELQEQKPYINILMLAKIILALAAGVAILHLENLAFFTLFVKSCIVPFVEVPK